MTSFQRAVVSPRFGAFEAKKVPTRIAQNLMGIRMLPHRNLRESRFAVAEGYSPNIVRISAWGGETSDQADADAQISSALITRRIISDFVVS